MIDIVDGKLKLVLGLIWTIILRYQIHIEEGKSARSDLLKWVRQQIPEYDIQNFTKDWNDGRAM
jgi:filamin